ncbi:MAG: DUF2975 domain-containing protein [Clostridium sp.]|nr:DUF2975 domain-containing protein [Clostridium sp.]
MKENAISKINKMGKIGTTLATIAKVFVILGLVFTAAGTILCACLPKDFLTMQIDSNLLMDINFASVGAQATDEEVSQMQKEIEQSLKEEGIVNTVSVNNSSISLDFTSDFSSGLVDLVEFNLHKLVWPMLAALLYLVMTLVTLFFISSLCKTFKNCASPFEDEVIHKMKMLAYSLIPWTILSSVYDAIAENLFSNSFHLSIGIDLGMVVTVLIILALAYIFQYGAVLQQESDETL